MSEPDLTKGDRRPPLTTDAPVTPTGGDSVQDLHRAHMAQMNDPVMLTADGVDETGPDRGDSVQSMHAVVIREHGEPRDGFEPVPFWVAIVCGGLLLWGGYYVGTNTAGFRADVFDRSDLRGVPDEPPPPAPDPNPRTVDELKATGARIYDNVCAACHMPDGKGQPGKYPPLAGSEWVVGEKASAARLNRIMLYGLSGPITVSGATYNDLMPARGSELKDYQIAAVLIYIRNNDAWGNKADPDNAKPAITADEVKAARTKEGARKTNGTQPFTAAELEKIPVTYSDTGAKTDPKK